MDRPTATAKKRGLPDGDPRGPRFFVSPSDVASVMNSTGGHPEMPIAVPRCAAAIESMLGIGGREADFAYLARAA